MNIVIVIISLKTIAKKKKKSEVNIIFSFSCSRGLGMDLIRRSEYDYSEKIEDKKVHRYMIVILLLLIHEGELFNINMFRYLILYSIYKHKLFIFIL